MLCYQSEKYEDGRVGIDTTRTRIPDGAVSLSKQHAVYYQLAETNHVSCALSMPTGNTWRVVCLEIRHRRECVSCHQITSWNMALCLHEHQTQSYKYLK